MCFKYWIMVIASILALLAGTLFLTRKISQKNDWLKEVNKKTADKKTGQLLTQDKMGNPIVLDWEKIAVADPAFVAKMASLTDITVQAHTPANIELLKQHPEAATKAKEMRAFEPFFKQGVEKVDWKLVEEQMKSGGKKFWKEEIGHYNQQDICWFVTAHDKNSDKPLGFVQFLLTASDPYGSIKVKKLMIYPESQHRGLGKLLISSIFKLMPFVNRIFLSVFCTNSQAQRAYTSYGFKVYTDKGKPAEPGTLDEYKTHFEYLTNQTNTLQGIANQMKEITR